MTELLEALSAHASGFALSEGRAFDPRRELDRCRELGIRLLTPGEPEYPQFLASAPDAPRALYVLGAVPAAAALALVGSRRPTGYGLRMAAALSAEAARSRMATVSGLARGIDAQVHRSTLEAGGITWAVLGSGLDRVYPTEHSRLAEEIVAGGGALISEVPLSGPPMGANFPRRNRIISGLAWGTVVVEGDGRSGALITARCAAEQGREVLAVPGPADSPMSEGPLRLLREGAVLVRHWEDVREALPFPALEPGGAQAARPAAVKTSSPQELRVLELIGAGEAHWEELLRGSGLGVDGLAVVLLELEMRGEVRSLSGQRYAKR